MKRVVTEGEAESRDTTGLSTTGTTPGTLAGKHLVFFGSNKCSKGREHSDEIPGERRFLDLLVWIGRSQELIRDGFDQCLPSFRGITSLPKSSLRFHDGKVHRPSRRACFRMSDASTDRGSVESTSRLLDFCVGQTRMTSLPIPAQLKAISPDKRVAMGSAGRSNTKGVQVSGADRRAGGLHAVSRNQSARGRR